MLNAQASREAKNAGMQLALDYAGDQFRALFLAELRAWCDEQLAAGRTEIAIEEFRAVAKAQPNRPQAWGALATVAMKAKIIAPLTREDGSAVYRAAESVKTHGHPVRVYRISPAHQSSASSPSHPLTVPTNAGAGYGANALSHVGQVRQVAIHGGNSTDLLAAVSAHNRALEGRTGA